MQREEPSPEQTTASSRLSPLTIAVTGIVRIDGMTEVVIEQTEHGETRYVPIGGEAFGYRVVAVGLHGATLKRGGEQLYLALGENKPDETAKHFRSAPLSAADERIVKYSPQQLQAQGDE